MRTGGEESASTPSQHEARNGQDAALRAELRRGWTTGTCAAAATKAAYGALLGLGFADPVEVRLPRGGRARLMVAERKQGGGWASAGIVKDAGDDPDVTHGCLVRVTVRPGQPGSGVVFRAGEGVGLVTRPGLPIAPGEPAINPVPRLMIRGVVEDLARACSVAPDVEVEIGIPGGEEIARRTLNARLGIIGGLSILGTTGVVVPYSCSAWIHSIHRGIDVARAVGLGHVAAATGSTSELAVQRHYALPDTALIDMGDFVGATLKYLRTHPVPRLSLAGGFAKLAKLARGALDLHSGRSRLEPRELGAELQALGADASALERASAANTLNEVLGFALKVGLPLADRIAAQARATARQQVGDDVALEVLVVDRRGVIVGHAAGW